MGITMDVARSQFIVAFEVQRNNTSRFLYFLVFPQRTQLFQSNLRFCAVGMALGGM